MHDSYWAITITIVIYKMALDGMISQCYKEEERNPQCPVCTKPFNTLAKPLPFAHCSQSYLICSLSGNPMNEHNPPMALPNGYVYGEQVSCRRDMENWNGEHVPFLL